MKEKSKKKEANNTNGLKKIGIIILLLALIGLYVVLPIMSVMAS